MTTIAAEANVTPGLLHHHFDSKAEMLESLLEAEITRFRQRLRHHDPGADPLHAYADATLGLNANADPVGARCWVSLLAEALRDPTLYAQVKRFIATETASIKSRGKGRLTPQESTAILAFVLGALLLGTFTPHRVKGFAAPTLHRLIDLFDG